MIKKQKGFTLIELLAVIVILAIIALIATPIILNLIKKARLGAAQDSAYALRDAAKLYYTTGLIDDPNFSTIKFICTIDGCIEEDPSNVGKQLSGGKKLDLDGTKPSSGSVTISTNGKITYTDIKYNNDVYTCIVPESGNINCTETGSSQGTSPVEDVAASSYSIKMTKVSSGLLAAAAIDDNGNLWTWGSNEGGYLGLGYSQTYDYKKTPTQVNSCTKFKEVSVGYNSSVAIDTNGNLWTWGSGGALGTGDTKSVYSPGQITSGTKFIQVASGNLALDEDGNIWTWSSRGSVPTKIDSSVKFDKIAAGSSNKAAIDRDGHLWIWGLNISVMPINYPDKANGCEIDTNSSHNHDYSEPTLFYPDMKFKDVAVGSNVVFVIDEEDKIWSFGYTNTESGLLGDGIEGYHFRCTPANIIPDVKIKKVYADGSLHAFALDENNNLWGWGTNYQGPIGIENVDVQFSPVIVKRNVNIKSLTASFGSFSLYVDENGELYGSGYNYRYIMGNENIDDNNYVFKKIDAGYKIYFIDKTPNSERYITRHYQIQHNSSCSFTNPIEYKIEQNGETKVDWTTIEPGTNFMITDMSSDENNPIIVSARTTDASGRKYLTKLEINDLYGKTCKTIWITQRDNSCIPARNSCLNSGAPADVCLNNAYIPCMTSSINNNHTYGLNCVYDAENDTVNEA